MRSKIFSPAAVLAALFFLFPTPVSACILWQTAEYENYANKSYLLGAVTLIITWIIVFRFFKSNPLASAFRWVKMLPVLIMLLLLISVPVVAAYLIDNTFDPVYVYFMTAYVFVVVVLPALLVNLIILWALRKKGWFSSQGLFLPSFYGVLVPLIATIVIIGIRFLLFPFTGDVYIPCPPGP